MKGTETMMGGAQGRGPDRWRAVVLIAAVLLIAGCFGGPVPESRYYVLEYEPESEVAGGTPLPIVIGVEVFATQPLYRDRRVAYRVSTVEMAYYPYRFWAAPPGELVASQVARQFRMRRVVTAVIESPFMVEPDWVIAGRVQRFEEVDRGHGWSAVCEVSARIETFLDREILAEETWVEEVATTERTPEAVADAMSRAVYAIGLRIENLVRNQMSWEGR